MLELSILIASVVVSIVTGIFVFARDISNNVNRFYAFVTFNITCLAVANYFSLLTDDRLWYIRFVIFFTTLFAGSLLYLVIYYIRKAETLSFSQNWGIFITFAIAFIDLTPIVFSGLKVGMNPTPIPSYAVFLFPIHMIICFGLTLFLLFKHMRTSIGLEHLQYKYMLLGVIPIGFFGPLTGFILPIFANNTSLVFITPLYGVFFVCLVGYSIVKHRLFDIKFYVLRAAAYVLAILVLSIIYVGPIIYVFFLIIGIQPEPYKMFLAIITFTLLAVNYDRVLTSFKKSTNRIFFRDSYDSASLTASVNRNLTTQLNLRYMLEETARIITENIRPEYCWFIIAPDYISNHTYRIVGNEAININEAQVEKIFRYTGYIDSTEYLTEQHPKLKEFFGNNDISIVVKLKNVRASHTHSVLGFMILGPKKSGDKYNYQDIQAIDSVAYALAIAIKNALQYEEIQQFNKTLQGRVEEATRKLRASNERLKKLDETKDDFISMASHQLRTPLTSVKGYISMVLDGDAGRVNDAQRKMLGQAFMSSQRMVYLISDLLNLSRLNTGRFVIESKPVNLRSIVTDEVSQLHETAQARGVTLVYDLPETFPSLMLDETKIHQVVMNFIDNAVYYTPTGGKITVSLSETPTAVELKVIDTGIGVPRHEQPHLFTKFYRANNARQARPDGTGLGLFMAKKVIMAHGGVIIFDSVEGKGSTFGFRLKKQPLAAVETAIAPVAAVDPPMPIAKPPA